MLKAYCIGLWPIYSDSDRSRKIRIHERLVLVRSLVVYVSRIMKVSEL